MAAMDINDSDRYAIVNWYMEKYEFKDDPFLNAPTGFASDYQRPNYVIDFEYLIETYELSRAKYVEIYGEPTTLIREEKP